MLSAATTLKASESDVDSDQTRVSGTAKLTAVVAQTHTAEADFVNALLATMSLEQKVAQMIQPDIRYATPDDVRRYGLGSILNGGGAFPNMNKHASVEDWRALADAYYFASIDTSQGSAGIPILWGTDAVHGHNNVFGATIFPHNIGLGATRNADLVEAIAVSTAQEVLQTGIDWVFAPTVAVVTDLRWGRTYESFGSDPRLVAELGAAAVRGLQRAGTIATAKHFIGDGGTRAGIDQGDTQLSLESLLDTHGAGYSAAIEADVQTVMASFNSWNGEKVHGSRELLQGVLRERMGFTGTVVSDWNGVGQVQFCTNTDCPQAFNAGIDIAMVPTHWKELLHTTVQQVRDGDIALTRIDDAVRRILTLKVRHGLFSGQAPSERSRTVDASAPPLGDRAHRELAAQAVRESLVLLKLRNQVLPLDASARLLVAGSAADSLMAQTGGWTLTWQGTGNSNMDFPGATSVFDGIAAHASRAGGTAVLSVDGSYKRRPDVAVVVLGEQPYAEGQGDVTHLNFSAHHPADLAIMRRLQKEGIPVVAVFVSGRPAWVNRELNASDAFVAAWLPGSEGRAIADVLFAIPGSENDFRGRLPMPWPATDINRQDASRAVDEFLFPIGFGLTMVDDSDAIAYSETAFAKPQQEETVVFSQRSQPPWILMLGDALNWSVRVGASTGSSQGERVAVESLDRVMQEDARRITWDSPPGKPAQVYWRHTGEETVDMAASLDDAAVLAVHMRVDAMPTRRVLARIDCVYPCSGKVDITDAVATKAMQAQDAADPWFDLVIPIRCFARDGAQLNAVSAPLVLLADGQFSMSLSDVRLRPARDGDEMLDCSEQFADAQG